MIAASPNGRVRLGPTILRLAGSARTDFVAVARPFLSQLSNELKETVDLSVIKKDHLVFIDQVIGSQRLRAVSAVGETFPLHCTANGKAYLAGLDDAAVARLVGTTYERRTPRTITRLDELLRDLKNVRKTGVAIDHEEHTKVSAPQASSPAIRLAISLRFRCRFRRNAFPPNSATSSPSCSRPRTRWNAISLLPRHNSRALSAHRISVHLYHIAVQAKPPLKPAA